MCLDVLDKASVEKGDSGAFSVSYGKQSMVVDCEAVKPGLTEY